jgi:hypothetical protein
MAQLAFVSDLAAGLRFFISSIHKQKSDTEPTADGPWMSGSILWDCSMDPYRQNEAVKQQ